LVALNGRSLQFGQFYRPKGENRTAQAFRPGKVQIENRPERATDWRALSSNKTLLKSKSMAFQKLTNLFPVRKSAVMFACLEV